MSLIYCFEYGVSILTREDPPLRSRAIRRLVFISRLQFGSVAVKHDSSIAAFAMADGFDPSGLSWA